VSCQINTLVIASPAQFTGAANLWREATPIVSTLVLAATAIGTGISVYNFGIAWWGLRLLLPGTSTTAN
jgi:hypothetical protein